MTSRGGQGSEGGRAARTGRWMAPVAIPEMWSARALSPFVGSYLGLNFFYYIFFVGRSASAPGTTPLVPVAPKQRCYVNLASVLSLLSRSCRACRPVSSGSALERVTSAPKTMLSYFKLGGAPASPFPSPVSAQWQCPPCTCSGVSHVWSVPGVNLASSVQSALVRVLTHT